MTVHAQTPNHIRRGPASAYLHWSDGTRYRIYSIACAVTTFPRLGPNTQDEPLSEGPCCWTFSHPPLRSHIGRYMGELLFPSVAPAAWGHPLLLAFIATVESCPWSLLPPLVGVADKISGRKKMLLVGTSCCHPWVRVASLQWAASVLEITNQYQSQHCSIVSHKC